MLGGGAGTNRDTFELLYQAEKYGARVALFGRKINLAESQLDIVHFMRLVADGKMMPLEAVRAYHAALKAKGITAVRSHRGRQRDHRGRPQGRRLGLSG